MLKNMAPSSSLPSLTLLPSRPTGLAFVPNKLFTTNIITTRRSCVCASKKDSYGHHYDGKLVDESMIVLRMRIREMEKKKKNENGGACSGWMEWERRYSEENYVSDICEAVGLLQSVLMETRPCLALGMLVLVVMSMSIPMSLAVLDLVGLARAIIASVSGIHV